MHLDLTLTISNQRSPSRYVMWESAQKPCSGENPPPYKTNQGIRFFDRLKTFILPFRYPLSPSRPESGFRGANGEGDESSEKRKNKKKNRKKNVTHFPGTPFFQGFNGIAGC